jgi:hypothetical protein
MAQVRNFECSNFADSVRAVVEMSLQIGRRTSKNLSVDQITGIQQRRIVAAYNVPPPDSEETRITALNLRLGCSGPGAVQHPVRTKLV